MSVLIPPAAASTPLTLYHPAPIKKDYPMNPSRRLALVIPVAFVLALGATSAFAGTTGPEFQTMYTTLLNWATGYLGKAIAIAAFILGAGIGVARSSPIPALVGVVFALFMVYVPTIIDSIMTATI